MNSNQIQTELNRLLDAKNGKKAALFNVIVYVRQKERVKYFKEMMNMICSEFPSRLIFIEADPGVEDSKIEIEVNLKDQTPSMTNRSDRVFIQASGDEVERIPFLVIPLLIPDLPIYLVWGEDPIKPSSIFSHFQHLATRIIFESESSSRLDVFSETLLNFMNHSSSEIVDMNWIRIAGWRQVVARAFDTKARLELLLKTSYMKLVYNDLPDSCFTQSYTQALYLQAWIASCLGWKFTNLTTNASTGFSIYYTESHRSIQVDMVPEISQQLSSEEIIRWELKDVANYDCVFTRINATTLHVQASNQYQCLVPFSFLLPTFQTAKSLMQEVFYQRVSEQYKKLLLLTKQIKLEL